MAQMKDDAGQSFEVGGEAREMASFSDKSVRHGFIRKVYGILFAQLALTTVIGGAVMHYGEGWARANPSSVMGVLYLSMFASFALICCFSCNPDMLRKTPQNYALLFLFTVFESIMVGFICIQYTQESVLIVTAITAFVVSGLTLFACQTKYDFTGMGPYLFVALLVLMGMGFILWIGSMLGYAGSPAFQTLRMVYSGFGAMLFSFYIVYDTQLIVGGTHKNQFSVDDYCWAAINLYLDIINLFMFLLSLFGDRR